MKKVEKPYTKALHSSSVGMRVKELGKTTKVHALSFFKKPGPLDGFDIHQRLRATAHRQLEVPHIMHSRLLENSRVTDPLARNRGSFFPPPLKSN